MVLGIGSVLPIICPGMLRAVSKRNFSMRVESLRGQGITMFTFVPQYLAQHSRQWVLNNIHGIVEFMIDLLPTKFKATKIILYLK
jgi:hypothetical protein